MINDINAKKNIYDRIKLFKITKNDQCYSFEIKAYCHIDFYEKIIIWLMWMNMLKFKTIKT